MVWPLNLLMSVDQARRKAPGIIRAALKPNFQNPLASLIEDHLSEFSLGSIRRIASEARFAGGGLKGALLGNEYDRAVGAALFSMLSMTLPKHDNPDELFSYGEGATPDSDRFWIGLQLYVFPKETAIRWTSADGREIESSGWNDRFWANSQRIWMKTLWWTYYLAWQGSIEKTQKCVAQIGSNNISQIVERARNGYNLGFLRALLGRLEGYRTVLIARLGQQISSAELINLAMKLHANYAETVCPVTCGNDSYDSYINFLFSTLVR